MGSLKESEFLQIAKSTLWFWLEFLEREGQVELKKTSKYTLVKVKNWEKYQGVVLKSDSNEDADGNQMGTDKNDKKEKNEKKEVDFSEKISHPSKKPNTEKGWRDLRRKEIGKEPTRTPRTDKQVRTFEVLKWKDYFREKGYEQHGMQFFLVDSKKREGAVSKLIIEADKTGVDFKSLIDWWFEGNGEWAQYEPEQCFMGKTIERFMNTGKGKNNNKPTTFANIYD